MHKEQARLKIRNKQTEVYFKKLKSALSVIQTQGGLKLRIFQFPLRIIYLD